ncbi:hypothetical protein LCGC14_0580060 [marine sediment metagenome]|uniref:Uncharacterized protein n=1 Tax=marine sediment metagenome TaxID=412755 RepID=A0A0F9RLT3_9ZZZZ
MTRKEFREYLNKEYRVDKLGKGSKNQYKPRTRKHGDYLWFQDRIMFEVSYQEYLVEHSLTEEK